MRQAGGQSVPQRAAGVGSGPRRAAAKRGAPSLATSIRCAVVAVAAAATVSAANAAPDRSEDAAPVEEPVSLSTAVDLPPWALDPPMRMPFQISPRSPRRPQPPEPVRPDAADPAVPGGSLGPVGALRTVQRPIAAPGDEVRTAEADVGSRRSDAPAPGERGADGSAPTADGTSVAAGSGHASVPEPDGYRMSDYRAPVPATLAGATVIDTAAAERLWRDGVRFIDVLPRPPRPALPEGTVWRTPPRDDIPGSLWLVNTGYGALAPDAEAYFLQGLATATGGDKSAPLVFYCQRDCWMSFNAARRALAAGYSAVHWYPHGTDGWADAGLPLARNEPEPGEPGYAPR